MKKLFVLGIVIVLFSCQQPITDAATTIIGYDISEEVRTPLTVGDISTVAVWEAYIKAHNEKDIATIEGLNATKNFKIKGPKGEVFNGSDEQTTFLKTWFESDANPQWTTKFLIANAFTSKEGVLKQYVTSSHDVTLNIDGKNIKVNQIHDALIVNGKVQEFTVHERVSTE
ncbi:MAG: hypothetical protein ACI9H1_001577 [Polaribacter sp.]|jgi:hypothetical protein